MPHKRANYSNRLADRKKKGNDLTPKRDEFFADTSLPKGAMRILNAAKIQEEYQKKKKAAKLKEGGQKEASECSLQIRPGEKMQDFSNRVEREMASGVRSPIKKTYGEDKKRRRKENLKKIEQSQHNKRQKIATIDERKIDWEKPNQRKRINDVVQAPPTLTRLPKQRKVAPSIGLKRQADLEIEREKAIRLYRKAKGAKQQN